jgi:hypothetical protein
LHPLVVPSPPNVYSPAHAAGLAGCSHRVGQLAAPPPELKPAGQLVHAAAPAALNVPAVHDEQEDEPARL